MTHNDKGEKGIVPWRLALNRPTTQTKRPSHAWKNRCSTAREKLLLAIINAGPELTKDPLYLHHAIQIGAPETVLQALVSFNPELVDKAVSRVFGYAIRSHIYIAYSYPTILFLFVFKTRQGVH